MKKKAPRKARVNVIFIKSTLLLDNHVKNIQSRCTIPSAIHDVRKKKNINNERVLHLPRARVSEADI